MIPLKRKLFSSTYTCTYHRRCAQEDSPPDHLYQEDFRYKESVEAFVEPSALILLGHERAARGIIHNGLKSNHTSEFTGGAAAQPAWARARARRLN
ncbi:hypothetical protein A2U01_0002408 [Trifolium medium]|uniref:Uncharacterized protein n=1 Tax=Trifolium medium TaxID=97028 RepID=A0A392M2P6_9FABA|nr:hypothetical protein [Trifolium medium]